uniref:hypothetical protein n=1 Tax=Roseivirga sp. TaxID=1964215 RepID=UPI004047F036
MKASPNPLLELKKFSKNRIHAIAKIRPVRMQEFLAAAKIQREAEHFGHLPEHKQNFKVASLKDEVELLKSSGEHYRKQTHYIDQMINRATMNLTLNLF